MALVDAGDDVHHRLAVGHVEHGLRGADSLADAAFVEAQARARGCAFGLERVDVRGARSGGPSRTRPTLQEAARALRYDALRRIAARLGAARVATAHTLDDQAETLLLRLLRGCAPDALGGIPERSPDGAVVRPLLGATREAVRGYACARGLAWREDASNASPVYARNRVRHELLPRLAAEFNPRLLRALANLAEASCRDAEWIRSVVDGLAQQRFERATTGDDGEPCIRIDPKGWDEAALPDALARRLVARAFDELGAGRERTRAHVSRVLDFLRRAPDAQIGRCIELPCGLRLVRAAHACELRGAPAGARTPGRGGPPLGC